MKRPLPPFVAALLDAVTDEGQRAIAAGFDSLLEGAENRAETLHKGLGKIRKNVRRYRKPEDE